MRLYASLSRRELREQVRVADQPTAATRDRTEEEFGHGAHHRDGREHDLGPVVRIHYECSTDGRRLVWPPTAGRAMGKVPTNGL
jgi:hypothetical protein